MLDSCSSKLDSVLYKKGIKDPQKLHYCMINCTLRFGRSSKSMKETLQNIIILLIFQNHKL